MLTAGDIAFTGFNSDDADDLSFVALVDIPAGTQIRFTDNGIFADGSQRATEGTFTFTAAALITAGTVVQPLVGSTVPSLFALAAAGDQVHAFQTDASGAITFIASVTFSAGGYLATGATSPNNTGLPTGLTQGTNAVAVGDFDNGVYNGPTTGSRAELLAAIHTASNWTTSNTRIADVTPGPFTVGGAAPEPVFAINEIDSDTPGTDAAEFVELYDSGVGGASLDGLVVVFFNGSSDLSYAAFDLDGFTTDADGFFVLGNTAVADLDLTFAGNLLQNGQDAVALYRGDAADFPTDTAVTSAGLVDAIVYDTGQADDAGLLGGLGETTQFDEAGNGNRTADALARSPDGTGTFVAQAPTPGAANIVAPPPPPPATLTAIFTIQGAGHLSALDGQAVVTEGIVTAVDSNGFYLQDATGDGNVNTSDGIFVFTSSAPTVQVGQGVRVSGTVDEFIPGGASTGNLALTEIVSPTVTILTSGNALPAATVIGGASGRQVPTQLIISLDEAATQGQINLNTPGTVNTFDPEEDSIDFFESLEGMRVTVAEVQAVSGTTPFGEIFGVATQATPTEFNANGGVTISGDDILTADFNPERLQIQLDTGILPGGTLPNVNVGDIITGVTGVVGYDFGEFQIAITAAVTVTPGDAAPESTALVGDGDTLTVAGYNVLNLDPNDAEASGNQPDTDLASGRFDLIAQQITVNLKLPDIIALQEVQDNNGGDFGGVVSADLTLQTLVDAIFAESGVRYEFLDNPFIAAEDNGGQPGGNIRTAFLYNPTRVDFVDGSLAPVTDPTSQQTNSADPFFDSRQPLAGTFTFNGEEITVVSVHNSSRGGSTPLSGAVQQPTLGSSETARNEQSQAINDFVDGILVDEPDANVVVIGDFNGFQFERWSDLLEGDADGGTAVLTNLTNRSTDPQDDYSFIFNGNAQALDHSFVSQGLVEAVTLDRVHVNVDFAAAGGIRASDHDPEVLAIDLGGPLLLTGTRVSDTLVGTSADEILDGLAARDFYTGGGGDDIFVLDASRAYDVVRDFGDGFDLLDVAAWGVTSFDELRFRQSGDLVQLSDANGHRATIQGHDGVVRVADFTADSFVFADQV